MGLILGERVFRVGFLYIIKVFSNNKGPTLLHDTEWFMTTSLVDVPNEIIMDTLKDKL